MKNKRGLKADVKFAKTCKKKNRSEAARKRAAFFVYIRLVQFTF